MDTLGRHILMDMWGCDSRTLDTPHLIHDLMRKAAKASGVKPLLSSTRHFDPQGVTGIVMVEESHFSIHTWPEEGYASIDAYTCGTNCDPEKAVKVFEEGLKAKTVEKREIIRGVRRGDLTAAS